MLIYQPKKVKESGHKEIMSRDWKSLDDNSIHKEFGRVDFSDLYSTESEQVDVFESRLTCEIKTAFDKLVPWKIKRIKRTVIDPWMNKDIIELIAKKKRFHIIYLIRKRSYFVEKFQRTSK